MISKPNSVISKGIVFAGCSFTWGQGLYYYSNMPSLKEPPPDHYQSQLVRHTHRKFQETIRYPRLVSNHFNTFELTQDFNGGATHSIIQYWNEKFSESSDHDKSIDSGTRRYDYDDVSHVFFQFTQWSRTELTITHNDKTFGPKQRYQIWQDPASLGTFIEWLNAQNITFDEFLHKCKIDDIARVKEFLENFESRGIKTAVLTWPEDMVEYIKNDSWLSERLIQLDHNGSTWSSIETLMKVHPELTINSDFEYFQEPPKDHHPSMKCHQIMAAAIIKHLEK